MLEAGSEIRVQDTAGSDAGVHLVRGLKAKGGQGYVYSLRTPAGRAAVLKVPSPKGLFGNEIEIRILKTLPPHKNVVRMLGTSWLQGVECAVLGYGHPNPYQRLNSSGVREVTRRYRGAAPRNALPATTAIEMIQEILAALEHLHRYGFVHGDIKPGNILVELETRQTRVGNKEYFEAIQKRAYRTVLADFGSTRSMTFLKEQDRKGKLLAPSEFTPVYAPPEVFRKEGAHSGTSVDVYQVGLLLYQLISGHLPYDHYVPDVAKNGLSTELVQLKRAERAGEVRCFDPNRLRQSRQGDVVFAEAFASQRLRDRFYDDVETFVELATRADPAERPSVSDLRQEMFRLFELEPPVRTPNPGRVQVAVWNPRWHLTRVNRLYEASRAPDTSSGRVAEKGSIQTTPLEGTVGSTHNRSGIDTEDIDTGSDTAPETGPKTVVERPGASRPAWERRSTPRRVRRLSPSESGDDELLDAVAPIEPPAPPPLPEPPRGGRSPTEVYLTAEDARALRAELEAPETEEDVTGLEVALIDDDRVALAVLGRSLRRRGCEVRTFQDPESGLESISRDQPHAAIVDMQMPGMSGLELIKRLRRRLGGLPFPVLVLSSVEEEEVLKDAYRFGVRDYLVKPVTEAELSVKLQKAVRESREENPQAVPRELAGFELQEEIRRGEVALVYTAVDGWQRYADPVKAIKVLRPDVSGDVEPLLKLRREIDVLSRCDHASLPRLREAGLLGRLLFYVADEVPGLSLGQRVRAHGPLKAGEVVYLLRDLAEGLGYLHTQGLVLGDLTPESVAQSSGRGGWMITELGNARTSGGVLRLDEPELPRSRFAAPELFEDPPQVDPTADLYSLGVCALEAYSNTPALRSRTSGKVDVAALGVGMPAPLVALLGRCVAPRLSDRFPNAHALLSELRRIGSRDGS